MLPVDREAGTALLVRRFRIAADCQGGEAMLLQACAGLFDAGDDPADTVREEAGREKGCRLHDVRRLGTVQASPGTSTETRHLFPASFGPDDRVGGGGLPAEGERTHGAGAAARGSARRGGTRRETRRQDRDPAAARLPGRLSRTASRLRRAARPAP